MQKRFLAMLLAIVMLLGLLVACGEQASVTEPTPSLQTPAVSSLIDTTSSTASAESTETTEPSPSTDPTPEPTPETKPVEGIDSASTLLPDLSDFLYLEEPFPKDHYAYGDPYGREVSFPYIPLSAYEVVREEVLTLMEEPVYQLELIEYRENAYYNLTAVDYYYNYTGTAEDITQITDKYEEKYSFHVMLRFIPDVAEGYFHIYYFYCEAFDLTDPGVRTTRNTETGSDGGVLPDSYVSDSDDENDFWKKCSACHGSGNCTHCGGDDEVRKFQAGLGWVEQNCTFCTGGRCRYCKGTGKD